MLAVWVALAVVLVVVTIGATVAFRRALALWRDVRRFRLALVLRLEGLGYQMEELSRRAGESGGSAQERLEPAVARLRASLAYASVLNAAVRDVQDAVGRVTAVYPSK